MQIRGPDGVMRRVRPAGPYEFEVQYRWLGEDEDEGTGHMVVFAERNDEAEVRREAEYSLKGPAKLLGGKPNEHEIISIKLVRVWTQEEMDGANDN